MGAVVIYAMAKNARGNGGKRASKTKSWVGKRVGSFSLPPRREGMEGRRRAGVSVRFRE